jgi:pre-mRNA-processing factor 40
VPGDGVRAPGSVGPGVLPPGVRPPGVRPPGVRPPGGVPPPGEGVPPPGEGVPPPGEGMPPPGDGVPPPGEGVPPPGVGDPPGNGANPEPGIRPGGKVVKLGSSGLGTRRRIGGIPIPGASVVLPGSTPGIAGPPEPGGLVPLGISPTRREPSKTPGARTLPPLSDGPEDRRGVPIPDIEPVIESGGVVRMIEPGGSARAGEELTMSPVTKQAAETLRKERSRE